MELIKDKKVGFWLELVVFMMSAVSLGIYLSNVNQPYYEDMNMLVVYFMVVALASMLASIMIHQYGRNKTMDILADGCRVVTTILIIVSGALFVGMRVESFGYIFGSNLEMGNDAAFEAGGQAITGIIVFVVTWILSVISSFLEVKKNS